MKKKWSKILLGSRTLLGSSIKRSEITGLFFCYSILKKLEQKDGNEGCKTMCFSITFLVWEYCRKFHRSFTPQAVPSTQVSSAGNKSRALPNENAILAIVNLHKKILQKSSSCPTNSDTSSPYTHFHLIVSWWLFPHATQTNHLLCYISFIVADG